MNKEDLNKTLNLTDIVREYKSIKKKDKKNIFYRILPEIFIPALIVLSVISSHSKLLIFEPLNYVIFGLLVIFSLIFIIGLFRYKKIISTQIDTIFKSLVCVYSIGCTVFLLMLYLPNSGFKSWLISTAMSTMNHQYLCKWFYNDNEIKLVLDSNYIKEVDEETDTSLIDVEKEVIEYANEYERAILEREEDAKYKIIELEVNGQKAYLAAIYDPSKVHVGTTAAVGSYGQYVTKQAERYGAILAINGGGFYDPGHNSTGGSPTGVTISNGKVVTNNTYGIYTQGGGIIGFDANNTLHLIKGSNYSKARAVGIRDAVTWGPFLIVNGKKSFISGNGGWGYAARTAIGQRADGIVLMLVVNSNATRTKGASMVDLTEIMYNHGAINAANLDGGTSTVMVLPKEEAIKYRECYDNYCYINDPIDGNLRHKTRGVATSFYVAE